MYAEIIAALSQMALTSATVYVPEGHQIRHHWRYSIELSIATRQPFPTEIDACHMRFVNVGKGILYLAMLDTLLSNAKASDRTSGFCDTG